MRQLLRFGRQPLLQGCNHKGQARVGDFRKSCSGGLQIGILGTLDIGNRLALSLELFSLIALHCFKASGMRRKEHPKAFHLG